MKTLTPNFNLLESEKTPDYSPHVAPVRLPLHFRERGRKLVAVHATKREMSSSFHTSEDVFEKLASARIVASFSYSHDEQIVTARVVSDEIAPFDYRNYETEIDEVFQFPVEAQIVTARVVSSEVAPFKWVEDEPDLDDEILHFETPKVKRRARVVSSQVAPFQWVSDDE